MQLLLDFHVCIYIVCACKTQEMSSVTVVLLYLRYLTIFIWNIEFKLGGKVPPEPNKDHISGVNTPKSVFGIRQIALLRIRNGRSTCEHIWSWGGRHVRVALKIDEDAQVRNDVPWKAQSFCKISAQNLGWTSDWIGRFVYVFCFVHVFCDLLSQLITKTLDTQKFRTR